LCFAHVAVIVVVGALLTLFMLLLLLSLLPISLSGLLLLPVVWLCVDVGVVVSGDAGVVVVVGGSGVVGSFGFAVVVVVVVGSGVLWW